MGYQIVYKSFGEEKKSSAQKPLRRTVAAGILVVLLVIGAITVKTTALPWIQNFLLPGDPAVTAAALEHMVDSLREGEGIGDAVTGFCREIVENAQQTP